jgi:hypothetical protein
MQVMECPLEKNLRMSSTLDGLNHDIIIKIFSYIDVMHMLSMYDWFDIKYRPDCYYLVHMLESFNLRPISVYADYEQEMYENFLSMKYDMIDIDMWIEEQK